MSAKTRKKVTVNVDQQVVEELKSVTNNAPTSETIRDSLRLMYALKSLKKDGFTRIIVQNSDGEKKELILP